MKSQVTVARLTRYAKKGAPGEVVQCTYLLTGSGMEGDFHAAEGKAQLSLLPASARRWMESQAEAGLCFGKFAENILLEGLDAPEFVPGLRLLAGEAELEISPRSKPCFAECPLFKKGQKCVLAGRNFFAAVVAGGRITSGDTVHIR